MIELTNGENLAKGFIYRPFIPLQVTPTVNLDEFLPFPREPSAVDQLAACVEPDGEAAERVRRWKDRRRRIGDIRPEFFRKITLENL